MTTQEYSDNTFKIIDEIKNIKKIDKLEIEKEHWETKLTCSKTMRTHDVELILIRIDERIEKLSKE